MYFFLQEDNANRHRHSILLSCQDPCGTTPPGPRSHLHNSHLPSIPKHPCHLPLLTRVHPCLHSLQRTNFLTTFAVSSFVRPEKIAFHFGESDASIRGFEQKNLPHFQLLYRSALDLHWAVTQGEACRDKDAEKFKELLTALSFSMSQIWYLHASTLGVTGEVWLAGLAPGTANHSWFPSGQNGHPVPSCWSPDRNTWCHCKTIFKKW